MDAVRCCITLALWQIMLPWYELKTTYSTRILEMSLYIPMFCKFLVINTELLQSSLQWEHMGKESLDYWDRLSVCQRVPQTHDLWLELTFFASESLTLNLIRPMFERSPCISDKRSRLSQQWLKACLHLLLIITTETPNRMQIFISPAWCF